MKNRILILVISLLSVAVYAQKSKTHISVFPDDKALENFQKQQDFLQKKSRTADSIHTELKHFFAHYKTENQEKLRDILLYLTSSFRQFTDFNARNLVQIDKHLTTNMPVQGSEITYLNTSYDTYSTFMDVYDFTVKSIDSLPVKRASGLLELCVLYVKLNQLEFFYKNYYTVIRNNRLRRILNAGDKSFDKKAGDFQRRVRYYLKRKNFKKLQLLARKNTKPCEQQPVFKDTSLFVLLKDKAYGQTRISKDKRKIKKYFRQDLAYRFGYFFTHHLSGAIGNFAGLFRFRKGYLYQKDSLLAVVKKHLHPMYILAEKTGFTLTDKMIPGYFGHIALWLGTEQDLKKLGIWNHPFIKPFQNRIHLGYSVLESVREGTRLSRLEDFMNIDELAIASIDAFDRLNEKEILGLYHSALSQLGKEYDFNFDVETSDKLVCSELLYQVFGYIHWPTDKYLKRNTISPDNVMSLTLFDQSPIHLTYYVGAHRKNKIYTKTQDDLAEDLGYTKSGNAYYLKQKVCDSQHNCKWIYHKLIYSGN